MFDWQDSCHTHEFKDDVLDWSRYVSVGLACVISYAMALSVELGGYPGRTI